MTPTLDKLFQRRIYSTKWKESRGSITDFCLAWEFLLQKFVGNDAFTR